MGTKTIKIETLPGCRRVNDEVYYSEKSPFVATSSLLTVLSAIVAHNPKGKARICCHASPTETLHDMLITLNYKAGIRPYKHLYKVEAF